MGAGTSESRRRLCRLLSNSCLRADSFDMLWAYGSSLERIPISAALVALKDIGRLWQRGNFTGLAGGACVATARKLVEYEASTCLRRREFSTGPVCRVNVRRKSPKSPLAKSCKKRCPMKS